MMFVQISKGRRREKEDVDEENKERDVSTSREGETESELRSEEFTTVVISPKHESLSGESNRSSGGETFFDQLKRRSAGKGESCDEDISIYTIEKSQGREGPTGQLGRTRSVGSQASDYPPHRLYFLPPTHWRDTHSTSLSFIKLIFCQCSLASFLLLSLISAALLFYSTERPYEQHLDEELNSMENSTMVSMATDLRILDPESQPWDEVLIKYSVQHRNEILALVKRGYKADTITWTFPGCFLSAVSIMTTFGLGAPLPQTTGGVIGGCIFAFFAVPIHTLLVIHLGRTISTKVQLFSKEAENKFSDWRQRIINVRRFGEDGKREMWPEQMFATDLKPPGWVSWLPVISSLSYYLLGVLLFGEGRDTWTGGAFVFFIHFSRGYASSGFARMGYAWYLEGASILSGLNIALLQGSPFVSLSQIARPYGLVTNSIH